MAQDTSYDENLYVHQQELDLNAILYDRHLLTPPQPRVPHKRNDAARRSDAAAGRAERAAAVNEDDSPWSCMPRVAALNSSFCDAADADWLLAVHSPSGSASHQADASARQGNQNQQALTAYQTAQAQALNRSLRNTLAAADAWMHASWASAEVDRETEDRAARVANDGATVHVDAADAQERASFSPGSVFDAAAGVRVASHTIAAMRSRRRRAAEAAATPGPLMTALRTLAAGSTGCACAAGAAHAARVASGLCATVCVCERVCVCTPLLLAGTLPVERRWALLSQMLQHACQSSEYWVCACTHCPSSAVGAWLEEARRTRTHTHAHGHTHAQGAHLGGDPATVQGTHTAHVESESAGDASGAEHARLLRECALMAAALSCSRALMIGCCVRLACDAAEQDNDDARSPPTTAGSSRHMPALTVPYVRYGDMDAPRVGVAQRSTPLATSSTGIVSSKSPAGKAGALSPATPTALEVFTVPPLAAGSNVGGAVLTAPASDARYTAPDLSPLRHVSVKRVVLPNVGAPDMLLTGYSDSGTVAASGALSAGPSAASPTMFPAIMSSPGGSPSRGSPGMRRPHEHMKRSSLVAASTPGWRDAMDAAADCGTEQQERSTCTPSAACVAAVRNFFVKFCRRHKWLDAGIVRASAAPSHCAGARWWTGIDREGAVALTHATTRVYSMGQNCYGELGVHDSLPRDAPTLVEGLQRRGIVAVAAGNEHSCFASVSGVVWSVGYNEHGQCGRPPAARVASLGVMPLPSCAPIDDSTPAVALPWAANGCEHTFVSIQGHASMKPQLLASGYNARGQLGCAGHGQAATPAVAQPVPLVADPLLRVSTVPMQVVTVAVSYLHSLFVTADGAVWGCGRNDLGQLGVPGRDDVVSATLVLPLHDVRYQDAVGLCSNVCRQARLQSLCRGASTAPPLLSQRLDAADDSMAEAERDVARMALGDDLPPEILPNTTADAVAFRSAARALRGSDVLQTNTTMHSRVDNPVVAVAAGHYHSVIVLADGRVFAAGRGDWGQTGLDAPAIPLRVFTRVARGALHDTQPVLRARRAAMAKEVVLHGALLHSVPSFPALVAMQQRVSLPGTPVHCIRMLPTGAVPVPVVGVACGYYHTLLLCADGRLLVCGRNDDGMCGIGGACAKVLLPRVVTIPGSDANGASVIPAPSQRAVAVAAGCHHSLAVCGTGPSQRMLAWGRNHVGQLGLGHTSPQLSPGVVYVPGLGERHQASGLMRCIQQISAGFYHSLLITALCDVESTAKDITPLSEVSSVASEAWKELLWPHLDADAWEESEVASSLGMLLAPPPSDAAGTVHVAVPSPPSSVASPAAPSTLMARPLHNNQLSPVVRADTPVHSDSVDFALPPPALGGVASPPRPRRSPMLHASPLSPPASMSGSPVSPLLRVATLTSSKRFGSPPTSRASPAAAADQSLVPNRSHVCDDGLLAGGMLLQLLSEGGVDGGEPLAWSPSSPPFIADDYTSILQAMLQQYAAPAAAMGSNSHIPLAHAILDMVFGQGSPRMVHANAALDTVMSLLRVASDRAGGANPPAGLDAALLRVAAYASEAMAMGVGRAWASLLVRVRHVDGTEGTQLVADLRWAQVMLCACLDAMPAAPMLNLASNVLPDILSALCEVVQHPLVPAYAGRVSMCARRTVLAAASACDTSEEKSHVARLLLRVLRNITATTIGLSGSALRAVLLPLAEIMHDVVACLPLGQAIDERAALAIRDALGGVAKQLALESLKPAMQARSFASFEALTRFEAMWRARMHQMVQGEVLPQAWKHFCARYQEATTVLTAAGRAETRPWMRVGTSWEVPEETHFVFMPRGDGAGDAISINIRTVRDALGATETALFGALCSCLAVPPTSRSGACTVAKSLASQARRQLAKLAEESADGEAAQDSAWFAVSVMERLKLRDLWRTALTEMLASQEGLYVAARIGDLLCEQRAPTAASRWGRAVHAVRACHRFRSVAAAASSSDPADTDPTVWQYTHLHAAEWLTRWLRAGAGTLDASLRQRTLRDGGAARDAIMHLGRFAPLSWLWARTRCALDAVNAQRLHQAGAPPTIALSLCPDWLYCQLLSAHDSGLALAIGVWRRRTSSPPSLMAHICPLPITPCAVSLFHRFMSWLLPRAAAEAGRTVDAVDSAYSAVACVLHRVTAVLCAVEQVPAAFRPQLSDTVTLVARNVLLATLNGEDSPPSGSWHERPVPQSRALCIVAACAALIASEQACASHTVADPAVAEQLLRWWCATMSTSRRDPAADAPLAATAALSTLLRSASYRSALRAAAAVLSPIRPPWVAPTYPDDEFLRLFLALLTHARWYPRLTMLDEPVRRVLTLDAHAQAVIECAATDGILLNVVENEALRIVKAYAAEEPRAVSMLLQSLLTCAIAEGRLISAPLAENITATAAFFAQHAFMATFDSSRLVLPASAAADATLLTTALPAMLALECALQVVQGGAAADLVSGSTALVPTRALAQLAHQRVPVEGASDAVACCTCSPESHTNPARGLDSTTEVIVLKAAYGTRGSSVLCRAKECSCHVRIGTTSGGEAQSHNFGPCTVIVESSACSSIGFPELEALVASRQQLLELRSSAVRVAAQLLTVVCAPSAVTEARPSSSSWSRLLLAVLAACGATRLRATALQLITRELQQHRYGKLPSWCTVPLLLEVARLSSETLHVPGHVSVIDAAVHAHACFTAVRSGWAHQSWSRALVDTHEIVAGLRSVQHFTCVDDALEAHSTAIAPCANLDLDADLVVVALPSAASATGRDAGRLRADVTMDAAVAATFRVESSQPQSDDESDEVTSLSSNDGEDVDSHGELPSDPATSRVCAAAVQSLSAMGFPTEWCAVALQLNGWDVVAAADWILDNADVLQAVHPAVATSASPAGPANAATGGPQPAPAVELAALDASRAAASTFPALRIDETMSQRAVAMRQVLLLSRAAALTSEDGVPHGTGPPNLVDHRTVAMHVRAALSRARSVLVPAQTPWLPAACIPADVVTCLEAIEEDYFPNDAILFSFRESGAAWPCTLRGRGHSRAAAATAAWEEVLRGCFDGVVLQGAVHLHTRTSAADGTDASPLNAALRALHPQNTVTGGLCQRLSATMNVREYMLHGLQHRSEGLGGSGHDSPLVRMARNHVLEAIDGVPGDTSLAYATYALHGPGPLIVQRTQSADAVLAVTGVLGAPTFYQCTASEAVAEHRSGIPQAACERSARRALTLRLLWQDPCALHPWDRAVTLVRSCDTLQVVLARCALPLLLDVMHRSTLSGAELAYILAAARVCGFRMPAHVLPVLDAPARAWLRWPLQQPRMPDLRHSIQRMLVAASASAQLVDLVPGLLTCACAALSACTTRDAGTARQLVEGSRDAVLPAIRSCGDDQVWGRRNYWEGDWGAAEPSLELPVWLLHCLARAGVAHASVLQACLLSPALLLTLLRTILTSPNQSLRGLVAIPLRWLCDALVQYASLGSAARWTSDTTVVSVMAGFCVHMRAALRLAMSLERDAGRMYYSKHTLHMFEAWCASRRVLALAAAQSGSSTGSGVVQVVDIDATSMTLVLPASDDSETWEVQLALVSAVQALHSTPRADSAAPDATCEVCAPSTSSAVDVTNAPTILGSGNAVSAWHVHSTPSWHTVWDGRWLSAAARRDVRSCLLGRDTEGAAPGTCVTLTSLVANTAYCIRVRRVACSSGAPPVPVAAWESTMQVQTHSAQPITWDPSSAGPGVLITTPDGATAAGAPTFVRGRPVTEELMTTAIYTGHDAWSIALGNVGLSSGMCVWDVRIDHLPSAYLFVGVAAAAVRVSHFLGADEFGWGYLADGSLYHDHGRVGSYGDAFSAGDVVRVMLDLDVGTLAFAVNGRDQGIAFRGLSGKFYPAVGFFSHRQQVSLLTHTMECPTAGLGLLGFPAHAPLEELEAAWRATRFLHDVANEPPAPSPWQGPAQHGIDLTLASTRRWLMGHERRYITKTGAELTFDTTPELLSSVHADCVTGSRVFIQGGIADAEQQLPAEVIGVFEGRVWLHRQGDIGAWYGPSAAPRHDHASAAAEDLLPAGAQLTEVSSDSTLPENLRALLHCVVSNAEMYRRLMQDGNARIGCGWSRAALESLVSAANTLCEKSSLNPWNIPAVTIAQLANTLVDAWGTMDDAAHVLLAAVCGDANDQALATVRAVSPRCACVCLGVLLWAWLRSWNDQVRCLLPLADFTQALFEPAISDPVRLAHPTDTSVSADGVWSDPFMPSLLAGFSRCRALLFAHTKRAVVHSVMDRTQTVPRRCDDDYDYPEELPIVTLDRPLAFTKGLTASTPVDRLRASVFGQLLSTLHPIAGPTLRLSFLHPMDDGQQRCFRVRFEGEGADDYSGPYREVFSHAADELQARVREGPARGDMVLPLFAPTPNAVSSLGAQQDMLVMNPLPLGTRLAARAVGVDGGLLFSVTPEAESALTFAGQLVGIALRSHVSMPLPLAPTVWKALVADSISDADVLAADEGTASVLRCMEDAARDTVRRLCGDVSNADPFRAGETLKELCCRADAGDSLARAVLQAPVCDWEDQRWCLPLATGDIVSLRAGIEPDDAPHVTVQDVLSGAFRAAVVACRQSEQLAHVSILRRGLLSVAPAAVLPLLTSEELRELVCGADDVDVDLLEANTEYDEGIRPADAHVQALWRTLRSFTTPQRQQFLRFVWARSRLPRYSSEFAQKFKLQLARPCPAPAPHAAAAALPERLARGGPIAASRPLPQASPARRVGRRVRPASAMPSPARPAGTSHTHAHEGRTAAADAQAVQSARGSDVSRDRYPAAPFAPESRGGATRRPAGGMFRRPRSAATALEERTVWARTGAPAPASLEPASPALPLQAITDAMLPTSHCCFFTLHLPAYSSEDVLRERLLYAITNCVAMDADFRVTPEPRTFGMDPMQEELLARFASSHSSLDSLLQSFFRFLHARTDMYIVDDSETRRMGFPAGAAERMVVKAFNSLPFKDASGRPLARGAAASSKRTGATPSAAEKASASKVAQDPKPSKPAANVPAQVTTPPTNATSASGGVAAVECTATATANSGTRVRRTSKGQQIPVGSGGAGVWHWWTQTLHEVTLYVLLREGAQSAGHDDAVLPPCAPAHTSVRVAVGKPPSNELTIVAVPLGEPSASDPHVLLRRALPASVRSGVTWTVERVCVCDRVITTRPVDPELPACDLSHPSVGSHILLLTVTLEKSESTWWRRVLADEPGIDASLVDSAMRVDEYDPETQAAIRKIMFEQAAKAQGGGRADEDSLQAAMRAAGMPP